MRRGVVVRCLCGLKRKSRPDSLTSISPRLRRGVTPAKRGANGGRCESLENRRLMSLTVEVRNADGSASADVSTVGQVLTLDVLAIVSSSNNDPTQDGFQDLTGSFIATAGGGASVAGNLAATNLSPFHANGAQPGTSQDLNGDGNLDVGSNDPVDTTGYFIARASPVQTADTGTIVGNTLEFKIATLSYTVTSLSGGGQTDINFIPYDDPSGVANASWAENGATIYPAIGGVFQAGSAFAISDPALVTAPVANNDSATVAENTPTTIHELKNDTVIDPLNPASVTIGTAAAHGTTTVQADGSILYTPTSGYTGADSFTYTVADNGGLVSNAATVSINVVATPAPTAGAVSATTFLDQPANIVVLTHDSSVGTLVPGSVTIAGAAAHGKAVAQSDGSIEYTPANGYLGTDTFTYTVSDSNNETSSPATVTVTVATPVGPTANSDSFTVGLNTPTSLDVLANDTLGSITANPKVYITGSPTNGIATVQSDNTILYTPTTGFSGSDSLNYVVVDSVGDASAPATVALTITAALPPTAADFTQTVLAGQATGINVLTHVTGGAGIPPTGVTIVTAPANGTAVLNSDGTITFTPAAGFVGTDSFTYSVTDTNSETSAVATVTLDVGTSISTAKGSTAKTLSFIDAAGGLETVSLNKGVAELFFSGTGSLTVAKNGKATVTGAGLNIGNIALSGTTAASALSIKGSVKTPVAIAGISSSGLLGSINAPSANLSGTIDLPSAGVITAGSISNATITINAAAPGRFALNVGAVTGTSITSAVPITSIKALSWAGTQTITAPSLASMSIKAGGLTAALSITGAIGSMTIGGGLTGTISAGSIKLLRATGAIAATTITVGGNIGSVSAASINTSTITDGGPLSSLHVSGFASTNITAGKVGSLSVGPVTTGNGGTAFGITGKSIGSFAGVFGATALRLSHRLLLNDRVLADYVSQKGIAFGDFGITING